MDPYCRFLDHQCKRIGDIPLTGSHYAQAPIVVSMGSIGRTPTRWVDSGYVVGILVGNRDFQAIPPVSNLDISHELGRLSLSPFLVHIQLESRTIAPEYSRFNRDSLLVQIAAKYK